MKTRKNHCVKETSTQYKSRPSPPYHANDCKGETKTGNDKQTYLSKADKRGVYHWIKIKTKPQTQTQKIRGTKYEIHDNRNRPFFVYDTPSTKTLHIYKTKYDEDSQYIPDQSIYKTTYKKLFVGDNMMHDPESEPCCTKFSKGNSILAQISSQKYVYIGEQIYTFETVAGDIIESYDSPIGNNDVPYPVAIGKTHLYFLLDAVAIPRSFFRVEKGTSLYGQYYGWVPLQENAQVIAKIKDFETREKQRKLHAQEMKKLEIKLHPKIIHKRHFDF